MTWWQHTLIIWALINTALLALVVAHETWK